MRRPVAAAESRPAVRLMRPGRLCSAIVSKIRLLMCLLFQCFLCCYIAFVDEEEAYLHASHCNMRAAAARGSSRQVPAHRLQGCLTKPRAYIKLRVVQGYTQNNMQKTHRQSLVATQQNAHSTSLCVRFVDPSAHAPTAHLYETSSASIAALVEAGPV